MSAANQMSQLPFDQGFHAGKADGETQRSFRCRPSLLRAIISDRYREEYTRGYKVGYFAATRAKRREELQQSKIQDREHER